MHLRLTNVFQLCRKSLISKDANAVDEELGQSVTNGLCTSILNGQANGWGATNYEANHLVFGTYAGTIDSAGNSSVNQPAWDRTGYSPGRYRL